MVEAIQPHYTGHKKSFIFLWCTSHTCRALIHASPFIHQQYTCMYTYMYTSSTLTLYTHLYVYLLNSSLTLYMYTPVFLVMFAIHLFLPLFPCTQPDWQPLFVQLQELRINLKQQAASVLGIISNAVMQGLIISILLLNMVGRFQPVDSYSLYICAIVIRVTELIMPLWFCCSLWNYKQLSWGY